MAVSDITGSTSSASLGATQLTGVQRVEQQQLQAAAQTNGQNEESTDSGASLVASGTAPAANESGEETLSTDATRGSIVDITV